MKIRKFNENKGSVIEDIRNILQPFLDDGLKLRFIDKQNNTFYFIIVPDGFNNFRYRGSFDRDLPKYIYITCKEDDIYSDRSKLNQISNYSKNISALSNNIDEFLDRIEDMDDQKLIEIRNIYIEYQIPSLTIEVSIL